MDSSFFKSYVASYISPIQTGFLMGFRKSYGGTVIMIPVKKNATGTEYTGIRRIPAGITNLGFKKMRHVCQEYGGACTAWFSENLRYKNRMRNQIPLQPRRVQRN
jgi:hypothetical protein